MPEKEGAEEKSTKSVVNKKQKQMMGEEGYDIARDMGRVRPSKDKKDATTMPVSKEMRKTQKVNKGPSALELVKKKYKGQIMDMKTEEAKSLFSTPGLDKLKKLKDFKKNADRVFGRKSPDLTKVAESFGGYIVESEVDPKTGKIIARSGEADKTKKLIKKTRTGQERGAAKLAKDVGVKLTGPSDEKSAAAQAFRDMKLDKDKKFSDLTPDVKTGMRSVASGKGKSEPKDQMSPSSGGKRKATKIDSMKSPVLRPTTGGRKIEKKFSPKQPSTTTQKALPVYKAGGPYVPDKTTFTSTGKSAPRMEPKPKGMTPTLPVKPPTRAPIPKDTGSLKDVPKVKQQFKDFRKKLDALKTDIKVDKDIEKNIARVERGKKISKGADFSSVSRKTGAMKSGPKVVKQLGRTPKLGGSVVKVVGKETQKAAAKTAAKQVTKTAAKKALQKGVAKSAAKAIPGLGSVLAGAEAGYRALKGDFKGAALSAGEAIPGVGLGFAGANIARDVSKAKKAAGVVKNVTKAKRAKDAVKVVTPTVVGSSADKIAQAKKGISNFAKTPAGKIAVVGGGAVTGKQIEKSFDPRKIKPPTVKGGRTGRRSAKS